MSKPEQIRKAITYVGSQINELVRLISDFGK
jgi:hypothetical protein